MEPSRRIPGQSLAILAGLGVPVLCVLAAWALTGGAVRTLLAVLVAALVNTPAPVGGGMLAQGVLRVRLGPWEGTFDADRSRTEALWGYFLLSTATLGGFFLAAPLVALVLRGLGPFRVGVDELLALGATLVLVAVSLWRHRPEVSLASLRRGFEQDPSRTSPEALARLVEVLSGLARSSGAVGHIGGIGARTVGLHEHLEAEALLRAAAERAVPGAAELHARCLTHLRTRAEPGGGFSVYPSGLPRVEYTVRALEALRGQLDADALASHRAALLACRHEDGRYGRSRAAPASQEATEWAARLEA